MANPHIELLAAVSKNGIIGVNGTLPWKIPEDLHNFRDITMGQTIIMGRKTWESLPAPLHHRNHIILSRAPPPPSPPIPNVHWARSMEEIGTLITRFQAEYAPHHRFYVIGGADVYRQFLDPLCPFRPQTLRITHIDKVIEDGQSKTNPGGTTVRFPFPTDYKILSYSLKQKSKEEDCFFQFITYRQDSSPIPAADITYKDLAEDILTYGHQRTDRTGTGTTSVFGRQLHFDLSGSVPLLTTKQVPWKAVVKELLWFLRGDTDASKLAAEGVRIWDGNSSREFLDGRGLGHLPEGDIGAGYGFQWRHFGGTYQTCKETYDNTIGYDQVAAVLDQLRTDPFSRRIFMSAWNPSALGEMALPPCHVSAQFYVEEDKGSGRRFLSCHMYQRSVDTFLGLPFNIMSYATLTHIFATLTGMYPKELIISTGDTHIYSDHVEQVKTQCQRIPYSSPLLVINPDIAEKGLEEITVDDFDVVGYFHHGVLKGKMAV